MADRVVVHDVTSPSGKRELNRAEDAQGFGNLREDAGILLSQLKHTIIHLHLNAPAAFSVPHGLDRVPLFVIPVVHDDDSNLAGSASVIIRTVTRTGITGYLQASAAHDLVVKLLVFADDTF